MDDFDDEVRASLRRLGQEPSTDGVLDRVTGRRRRLVRRRRAVTVAVTVAVVAVVGGAIAVASAPDDPERLVTDEPPTAPSTTTSTATTSTSTSTSTSTTTPTTTVAPVDTASCSREAVAASIGAPVAFVDAPVCVETFSVVWICDPERRADCPEGRTILALDRGAWTIVGRSERLCLEDLVVHMPEPAALRFDAFLWCQRSLDELIGAALLEPGGLGPVRIGMTVAEIEAATRSRLDVPEGDDSVGVGDCRWVGLGSPAEVDLIVRAPAGTPPGDLHRVAVVVSIWGYIGATERGVGLGDPQAEALAAYPDAEVQPNVWSQPNGLWISWPTRDHPQAITFETDGARVTAIHAGRHLPEGCHP